MMKSIRILRSEYGLSPNKAEKVESRRHLSPEQYTQLLESVGFQVKEQRINTVQVPLEGWLNISEFEDWIRGVMPGVPLKEASEALKKGAREVFKDMQVTHIPRNWLEIVASRPVAPGTTPQRLSILLSLCRNDVEERSWRRH